MPQILLVDNRPNLQLLYSLNFKTYLECDIVIKENLNAAINYLEAHEEVSIIISRQQIHKIPVAFELYEYIDSHELYTPIIILGTDKRLEGIVFQLNEWPKLKEVLKICADTLGITAKKMAAIHHGKYYAIPAQIVRQLPHTSSDIFVKSPAGDMSLAFPAQKDIDVKEVDKYCQGYVEQFYILSQERLTFSQIISDQILQQLQSPQTPTAKKVELLSAGLEFTGQQIAQFGINENTLKVINECVVNMVKILDKNSMSKKLLHEILNAKNSYRYQHCQFTVLFCSQILTHLDWGTREQIEKLSFVSFMHDITLRDDSLVKIHTLQDLQQSQLSEEQKKDFNHHAVDAAQLAQQIPHLPMGADTIILQHHGIKNGIGLTEQFTDLSPLGNIFLVAEESTHYCLKLHDEQGTFESAEFIAHLQNKFRKQNFRKIIRTLEKFQWPL